MIHLRFEISLLSTLTFHDSSLGSQELLLSYLNMFSILIFYNNICNIIELRFEISFLLINSNISWLPLSHFRFQKIVKEGCNAAFFMTWQEINFGTQVLPNQPVLSSLQIYTRCDSNDILFSLIIVPVTCYSFTFCILYKSYHLMYNLIMIDRENADKRYYYPRLPLI